MNWTWHQRQVSGQGSLSPTGVTPAKGSAPHRRPRCNKGTPSAGPPSRRPGLQLGTPPAPVPASSDPTAGSGRSSPRGKQREMEGGAGLKSQGEMYHSY